MKKLIFAALCIAILTSCASTQTEPLTDEEREEARREWRMNRVNRIL